MTTSDDEPMYAHDEPLAGTTHAEPLGDPVLAEPATPARWPLAVLAAIGVMLLSVAVWAFIYAQFEREYVGVSVVMGLAVGWVVRVVSGRSTIPARVIAVVVTAIGCVLGTLAGWVAYSAKGLGLSLTEQFADQLPNTGHLLRNRAPLTWAIFVAALVLAWLSAGPQKENPKKAKKARGGATLSPGVPPASDDETYRDPASGDHGHHDAAGGERASDDPPGDPRLTAG